MEDIEGKTGNLIGKVALITGGGRGIGSACAILLAEHGVKVVVNYHKDDKSANALVDKITAKGGLAMAVRADVSSEDDVRAMFADIHSAFGPIDILVNNANREVFQKSFESNSWRDFQSELDVTLKGAINCIMNALPGMIMKKKGKIINILTSYSINTPPPSVSAYLTAKYSLLGLSKSLAVELGPKGICVNMVSPGLTDTDMTVKLPDVFKRMVAQQTPLRRIARPEDIAKAVLFLTSDDSDYLCGVNIPVCGGSVMS